MEKNDARLQKFVGKIIDAIISQPDNQKRELLIVMQQINFSDKHDSKLLDICIEIWRDISIQASLRFNAFRLIIIIVRKHLNLIDEIVHLTEYQYLKSLSNTARKAIFRMLPAQN